MYILTHPRMYVCMSEKQKQTTETRDQQGLIIIVINTLSSGDSGTRLLLYYNDCTAVNKSGVISFYKGKSDFIMML